MQMKVGRPGPYQTLENHMAENNGFIYITSFFEFGYRLLSGPKLDRLSCIV